LAHIGAGELSDKLLLLYTTAHNDSLTPWPALSRAQMCERGGYPQGFALFSKPADARVALEIITHLQFDNNIHLRCEMARKDMYVKVGELCRRKAKLAMFENHLPSLLLHRATQEGDPTIWRAPPQTPHILHLLHNSSGSLATLPSSTIRSTLPAIQTSQSVGPNASLPPLVPLSRQFDVANRPQQGGAVMGSHTPPPLDSGDSPRLGFGPLVM